MLAAALGLSCATASLAYTGDSFIRIAGGKGAWHGKAYKGWIRVEAHEWVGRMPRSISGLSEPLAGNKMYFGGPNVVPPGNPGQVVITMSKTNPDLPQLMGRCASKAAIPELTYAESSDLARPGLERGVRPAQFPAWWEYRLKQVRIVDCPVLAGADQQALVLAFDDIDWLNYDADRPIANTLVVRPQDLPDVKPVEPTARRQVHSYLVTWAAPATDTTDQQCPVLNGKPTETEILRYLTPEEIAAIRAKSRGRGIGAGYESERRGPHRLDVTFLPGIVPDPGLQEPQTFVAPGLDLDGDDGSGPPPKGIRKHENFTAPDGRKGIDNELFRVMGCVPGERGKKGYANQTPNARRADGNIVTLIEVSGITNDRNDNDVQVAIIHSLDKPIRDNRGSQFIPGYTFRPTDDPNFALYNIRVHGRIVNGAVITDPIPRFQFNPGQGGITDIFKARLRLDPLPDGSVRGTLGGYVDWKRMMGSFIGGYGEGLFNYQTPAIYYALKRHADGLQDPVTHEFNGISVAYEIDTVPAFVTGANPPAGDTPTESIGPQGAPRQGTPRQGTMVIPSQRYSTARTTLAVLYGNPMLKAIVARDAPDLIPRTDLTDMAMAMTLHELKDYWRVFPTPPDLSDQVLANIDRDLAAVQQQD